MVECSSCDGELGDNTTTFECDGCTAAYHYKCGGVTKKDIAARTSSKFAALLHEMCFKPRELYRRQCENNYAICL